MRSLNLFITSFILLSACSRHNSNEFELKNESVSRGTLYSSNEEENEANFKLQNGILFCDFQSSIKDSYLQIGIFFLEANKNYSLQLKKREEIFGTDLLNLYQRPDYRYLVFVQEMGQTITLQYMGNKILEQELKELSELNVSPQSKLGECISDLKNLFQNQEFTRNMKNYELFMHEYQRAYARTKIVYGNFLKQDLKKSKDLIYQMIDTWEIDPAILTEISLLEMKALFNSSLEKEQRFFNYLQITESREFEIFSSEFENIYKNIERYMISHPLNISFSDIANELKIWAKQN